MRRVSRMMKQGLCMTLSGLLAISVVSGCGTTRMEVQGTSGREAHDACMTQLFGDPVGKSRLAVHLAVTLRVIDACGVDKQIELSDHGQRISIVITVSENTSVRSQLQELARLHPDEPVASLCQRVELSSRTPASPTDHEKAARLLQRLEASDFFAVPQTDLYLHGRVYSLWITRVPNRSYHEFSGPDGEHTDEPLEHWAFDVLQEFGLLCEDGSPG